MNTLARPPCCLGFHGALETSTPTPFTRTRRLEHERREVRGKTKVHLPDRLIPGLGGEYMMPQDLDVAEVALQRATRTDSACARHAVYQLHCLRRAACRVGHGEQQVRFLTQRMGLSGYGCLPRVVQGVVEQQAPRA